MYDQLARSGGRELVRKINTLERRLDDLTMPEISPSLADPLLSLPALVGAWVGAVDADGDWKDSSGNDNHLNNWGQVNIGYDGIVPWWALDGAGDYFKSTDADFAILGTETHVAVAMRGLTAMLWFYPEETGTLETLISKWGAAGDRAYRLYLDASDQVNMEFSDDGTNSDTATSSALSAMNAWYFAAGRVIPSSFVSVFVGSSAGLGVTHQATAQASIHNTATDFNIGSENDGTNDFQGYVACGAVCACACSTAIISNVFNRMRGAFGV